MKKLALCILVLAACSGAEASWYWPFSSDDEAEQPRISDLMEPASLLIDEATDLAADGKTSEAVEKCREALKELDRVEAENIDRVATPEFNTLKNKRAYVTATIDSLLLSQAQDNVRAIAISDTTELQKKYDAQHGKGAAETNAVETAQTAVEEPAEESAPEPEEKVAPKPRPVAKTFADRLALGVEDLQNKDYEAVLLTVGGLLEEEPNDAAALNLKAAAEAAKGEVKAAEATLDRAIQSNPRSHYAYYNMARLLHSKGNVSGAKRYYDTGRTLGGPADATLEALLK